jgi:hypothetical protein
MVVLNTPYFDPRHGVAIQAAIRQSGLWVMVRHENEAIRASHASSELPVSIADQGMTMPRATVQGRQIRSSFELLNAPLKHPRALSESSLSLSLLLIGPL